MRDLFVKLAGPHGGGYLLLAALPFGFGALLLLLYLVAVGLGAIVDTYEMVKWWLW